MVLPSQPSSTCPLKPTAPSKKDSQNTITMDRNHYHHDILHFPGQYLHYHRHPPSQSTAFEHDSTPIDTHTPTHRRVLHRANDPSILTTVTIPSTTTTTSSMTTFADSTVPASTASTITTTPTIATTAAMATSTTTAPKINSQSTHPTAASRHEIILLALGIFILVAQLALVIWVGVRRRRVSLSSSASGSSSTCAYHHSRWHRENCPRELDGLQLDGRGSHGHAHAHKGKCLWNGAFGESPTSPGGWRERTRGLRVGEDVEGQEEKEKGLGSSSGSGSGFDEDMGEGEGEREGIGSRGNSVVIAGAQELMERVRKRSNSSGTFFKMIGAGKGQHVEGVPEDQTTVTRKRSDTFTMVLGRRFSGGGDSGLKERKGSAVNAAATTTAREGDVEMGAGKTSGLSTDFGGKFDGTEERNGGSSSSSSGGGERRRGSWVQGLRRYSGFGNQYGVQDPEKGGFGTEIPRELGDKAAVVGYLI